MDNADLTAVVSDARHDTAAFLADVVTGLRGSPKTLPCKYFYDERGSQLFDEICELDEYYLTQTEDQIIRQHAREMADQIGPGVMLVEYGSGSSTKTRGLLDHLTDPVAYVPVDISQAHLYRTAAALSRSYPKIEILPVCADFTQRFELPRSQRKPSHSAVFFPGSTIGNFRPAAAQAMLAEIALLCGTGGGLLIGIDLRKDRQVLESAYNDARGVTAQFNRNLLCRIRRELDVEIDPNQFRHRARYDEAHDRIEMALVSCRDQRLTIDDQSFEIAEEEAIITEHSHKYTIDGFASLAAEVGLTLRRSWLDDRQWFAVLHFALLV